MHTCQQLRGALTTFYSFMHYAEVIWWLKNLKQWEADYEEGNAMKKE